MIIQSKFVSDEINLVTKKLSEPNLSTYVRSAVQDFKLPGQVGDVKITHYLLVFGFLSVYVQDLYLKCFKES